MYDYFIGKLEEVNPAYAVINCGGVGYMLHISLHTYSQISHSEPCKLYAHLAIKEDAHTLYGFSSKSERETFRQLINVSGVGAATARVILSSLNPVEIAEAVAAGNVHAFKSVKGIGEKTAQRIIIDLKGKLNKENVYEKIFSGTGNNKRSEALTALTLLGFPKNLSEKALDKIMKSTENDVSIEELIKQTLRIL